MLPFAGLAQTGKATLIGRVIDAAGAVLQGAEIQTVPSSASHVSDKQGEFIIPNLAP
jgi:hypothetical protein